jgi:hypothetical protein
MTENVVPVSFDAITGGFLEQTISFLITDSSGKVIRDYSINRPASSQSARGDGPAGYILTLSALSPSESAYEEAVIYSITYSVNGESHTQAFNGGGGVSITRDAEIADEYFEEPNTPDDPDDPNNPGDGGETRTSSGGGCAAGTFGASAAALAAGARALRGKRK